MKMHRQLPSWFLIYWSSLLWLHCMIVQAIPIWNEVCTQYDVRDMPFCSMDVLLEDRVDDYVNRIPTEQQVQMMHHVAAAYPLLHIPPYQWWSEGLHGAMVSCVHQVDHDYHHDDDDDDDDDDGNDHHNLHQDADANQQEQQSLEYESRSLSEADKTKKASRQVRSKCPTSFPAPSGLGSTWNRTLWTAVANVIGKEGRALLSLRSKHASNTKDDLPIGEGLTYWSPTINLQRDPRWGRNQEVPSEDPYLTGQYAISFVQGLQNTNEDTTNRSRIQIAAGCKHFVANSLENWYNITRHDFNAHVSKADLYNYYLPPFRDCVRTGKSRGVMCSYNAVNGEPSCSNSWLLRHVLRKEWNFDGYVVSDCGALADIQYGHAAAASSKEAAAKALNATTDVNCGDGSFYPTALLEAYQEKMVTSQQIQESFRRMVRVQMELGLFDNNKGDNKDTVSSKGNAKPTQADSDDWDIVDSPEHQQLAYEAALQSIILLKNDDDTLPLPKTAPGQQMQIAVIGPHVDSTVTLLSTYFGQRCPDDDDDITEQSSPFFDGSDYSCIETPFQALQKINPGATMIGYTGCSMSGTGPNEEFSIQKAIEFAKESDIVILTLGLDQSIEREGVDRYETTLPGMQSELAGAILDLKIPKVVLVLFHGGTVSLGDSILEKAPAIVSASYGGQAASRAMASVLFGDYNPTGKLAATVYPPDFVHRIPMTEMGLNVPNSVGRTYMYYNGPVEFPFGHGLSYSRWAVEWMTPDDGENDEISTSTKDSSSEFFTPSMIDLELEVSLDVHLTIHNLGSVIGSQTVLVFWKPVKFLHPESSSHSPSAKVQRKMCAFGSTPLLEGGISHTLELSISGQDFAMWQPASQQYEVMPGLYELQAIVAGKTTNTMHSTVDDLHPLAVHRVWINSRPTTI